MAGTEPSAVRDVTALTSGLSEFDVVDVRARYSAGGIDYGLAFQGMVGLWGTEGRAVARIVTPEGVPDDLGGLTPAVLDAVLDSAKAGKWVTVAK